MLEIKDLFVSYGMMEVLHGISLKVEDRELVSVIGPNGAGKSTSQVHVEIHREGYGETHREGDRQAHVKAHRCLDNQVHRTG